MALIVTGAAGFIGSNLVKALNARGLDDIIAVDNLSHAEKVANLADCEIADFLDKRELPQRIASGALDGKVTAVLHEGACSDTMETDGRYMMDNNYGYSVALLDWCRSQRIAFLYASSASVYGAGRVFAEARENERPLNVYGYSKFLFDQVVRRRFAPGQPQVAGFRYFNVYGPREAHKGRMASVAFHFYNQYRAEGRVRLFDGSAGYGPGEQVRDFISVEDVVAREPAFPGPSAALGHLQRRHRPRRELQRGGARDHQRGSARARRGPALARGAALGGRDRVHRLSARAGGQVPELHPGRRRPAARDRIRRGIPRRRGRRGPLRGGAAGRRRAGVLGRCGGRRGDDGSDS